MNIVPVNNIALLKRTCKHSASTWLLKYLFTKTNSNEGGPLWCVTLCRGKDNLRLLGQGWCPNLGCFKLVKSSRCSSKFLLKFLLLLLSKKGAPFQSNVTTSRFQKGLISLVSTSRHLKISSNNKVVSLPRDRGGWIALKMVSALRHLISLILEKFHEMMTELWCCFENYSLCLETIIRWWMLGLIQVSTSRHTEDCSHGNKMLMTQDSSLRLGWLICHWSIIGLNEMHWKLRVMVSTSRLWQVVFEVEAL